MCIKNRAVSLFFKLLVLGVSGFGILSYLGLLNMNLNFSIFNYYTILNNTLVFVFYLFAFFYVMKRISKNGVKGYATFAAGLKGAVLAASLVSLAAYFYLMLQDGFYIPGRQDDLREMLVHFAVPALVLFDWLLFDRKGSFRAFSPLLWTLLPLAYTAYVYFLVDGNGPGFSAGVGETTWFPYLFINSGFEGSMLVLVNGGILAGATLVLGYLFFLLDMLLGRHVRQNIPQLVYKAGDHLPAAPEPSAETGGAVPFGLELPEEKKEDDIFKLGSPAGNPPAADDLFGQAVPAGPQPLQDGLFGQPGTAEDKTQDSAFAQITPAPTQEDLFGQMAQLEAQTTANAMGAQEQNGSTNSFDLFAAALAKEQDEDTHTPSETVFAPIRMDEPSPEPVPQAMPQTTFSGFDLFSGEAEAQPEEGMAEPKDAAAAESPVQNTDTSQPKTKPIEKSIFESLDISSVQKDEPEKGLFDK